MRNFIIIVGMNFCVFSSLFAAENCPSAATVQKVLKLLKSSDLNEKFLNREEVKMELEKYLLSSRKILPSAMKFRIKLAEGDWTTKEKVLASSGRVTCSYFGANKTDPILELQIEIPTPKN